TEDVCEMQPVFSDDQSVLYHTYSGKEIRSMHLQTDNKKIDKLIYCHTGQLNLSFPSLNSNKSEVRIPGTVPYVHQVYDTPDWHYGYGSCAPSTSAMALAYYNRLPKWPKTVSSPYSHISDYGYYVADKYTIDEYYYDVVEQTGGGEDAWGGYGYMWGLGSPNSYMSSYIAGHYLTSSQLWSSSCTFSVVTNEIDDGYPYPMCAMLSSAGHLVLTKGYIVGQHTLIFNDPYGDKNTPGWPSYDGHNAYYDWPGYNNGYQNLDYNGTYGIIAWLVTSRGSEVTYNDTLIDDLFYNHGFNMNNSANGSHMRYFHDVNAGYDNHFWFTYTMDNLSDICWVTWEPVLPKSGMYEVSAFIPSVSADAAGAIYHVKHAGGETIVLIDQDTYNDQWVSLGTYTFDTSMVNYVYLGDSTGIDGESIAFDAVKWSYMPVPDVDFYAGTQVVCTGETVQFNNASVDADTWLWTFEGGDPVSSSEENPAVTYNAAGNWDVTLVGSGTGGSDTLYFDDYITVHASPVADFEANDTVIYLPTAVATFNNFSSDAASYFWDFGNGQTSSDSNPYCIYTLAGDYTVSLVAGNGNCPNDTLMRSTYIHVMNGTSDNDPQTKKMSVYPNPFSETIQIDNPNGYLISGIRITDMAGRIMYRKKLESQGDLIIENILTDAERGVYVLILMVNGSETRFNMIKE
ncbi:MAG: PKD domain-containing protein, partial [Bacteroidota bacterium]